MELSANIDQLKKYTNSIYTLPAEQWNAFAAAWQPFTAKRKTVLTTAGDTENYLYFVTEGVQRAFYLHDNDKEAIIVFTYPYSFAGVADSFLTRRPSLYFFETLTASSFLRTSHAQMQELMNKYPAVGSLFFKTTAFAFAGVLERQIELQCFTAEEKFRILLKRSPHVLQLIPHKYLASYLALMPVLSANCLAASKSEKILVCTKIYNCKRQQFCIAIQNATPKKCNQLTVTNY